MIITEDELFEFLTEYYKLLDSLPIRLAIVTQELVLLEEIKGRISVSKLGVAVRGDILKVRRLHDFYILESTNGRRYIEQVDMIPDGIKIVEGDCDLETLKLLYGNSKND